MQQNTYKIHNQDCLETLKELPDNSVDSVVSDPPYGLSFMNKKWDHDVPSVELWQEAYRVLKPGGHLLAFFGSRTYHRGAVNIEDAGFEIRDQMMWLYGSGFPKSHNIGKAIDKKNGTFEDEGYEATNTTTILRDNPDVKGFGGGPTQTPYQTNNGWQGWGTALKPSHEPIVVARKPFKGTVVDNVLTYGTGGINIDDSRCEGGRWPANIIHDGSDEVVNAFPYTNPAKPRKDKTSSGGTSMFGASGAGGSASTISDNGGSAARFFYSAKVSKKERNRGCDHLAAKACVVSGGGHAALANGDTEYHTQDDAIGLNKVKVYQNNHPTVKPVALMSYLVRLVTPVGGTVLDPYTGSGATGIACMLEGMNFIGCELDENYAAIAEARIGHAQANPDEWR